MNQKTISLALGALAIFGIGVAAAQATSYSSCTNSYQQGTAAPAGYGSAWDFITGGLAVSVDCNANAVTVGTGNSSQYIFKLGCVYQNNAWQQLNLTSSSALISNNWYTGSATANLGSVDLTQTTYVVGYVCDWSGSVWKCGCADNACATSSWQLQAVQGNLAQAQTTTSGQNTTGSSTQGGTIEITPALINSNATISVSIGSTLHAGFQQNGQYIALISSNNTTGVLARPSGDPGSADIYLNAVGQGTAGLTFQLTTACSGNCNPTITTGTLTVIVN
jgi:hypothetical protein